MASEKSQIIEIKGEDISPNKDEGLLKEILQEGTSDEKPFFDDKVTIHCVGRRLDGVVFRNTRDYPNSYSFHLGQEEVVKALDVGVATMKLGEIARFISKPKYAYGQKGFKDKVGPNTIVAFDVELISFVGRDLSPKADGTIIRRITKLGERRIYPNEGANMQLMLKGMHDGQVFDERTVDFIAGEGCAENIPECVEICACRTHSGDHCKLYVKGAAIECLKNFNVPLDATVEYELQLLRVEPAKNTKPYTDEQKLAQSEILKARADLLLKGGHYEVAIKKYRKIYEYLLSAIFNDEADRERCKQVKIASQLNLVLCYMKMGDYYEAKRACNRGLDFDDKNEKCLFRRGQCHLEMRFYDRAIKDFETVLKINPSNAAAQQRIDQCHQLIKQHEVEEKKLYKNFFNRSSKSDSTKSNAV